MSLRAEILAIGDELTFGHCIDTNSAHIARALTGVGCTVGGFHVVSDTQADIEAGLLRASAHADVVVTTGGLGPTLDDRTRHAAAAAAGQELVHDEVAWQQILAYFARLQRLVVPESNRRQALRPAGAELLENRWGSAPGFALRLGRALVFVLPGVPREMYGMLEELVLPRVRTLPGGGAAAATFAALKVLGPSEAALGERIAAFMVEGRNPAVGITASHGLLTVRIAARGADAEVLCAADRARLLTVLGDDFVCDGDAPLQVDVAARLRAGGKTLALAESCTAGLAAGALGDVPGVSAVLRGGVVAYADAVKIAQLGVDPALLAAEGAVSEPVAAAMAKGVAARLGADLGGAITGIAGPDGGTPEKPVGTVCFGLASRGEAIAWTRKIPDLGREFVRRRAVAELFAALIRHLR